MPSGDITIAGTCSCEKWTVSRSRRWAIGACIGARGLTRSRGIFFLRYRQQGTAVIRNDGSTRTPAEDLTITWSTDHATYGVGAPNHTPFVFSPPNQETLSNYFLGPIAERNYSTGTYVFSAPAFLSERDMVVSFVSFTPGSSGIVIVFTYSQALAVVNTPVPGTLAEIRNVTLTWSEQFDQAKMKQILDLDYQNQETNLFTGAAINRNSSTAFWEVPGNPPFIGGIETLGESSISTLGGLATWGEFYKSHAIRNDSVPTSITNNTDNPFRPFLAPQNGLHQWATITAPGEHSLKSWVFSSYNGGQQRYETFLSCLEIAVPCDGLDVLPPDENNVGVTWHEEQPCS